MYPMTTGEKLRHYRKTYKIKQVELYSGIMSQSMYSFIEKDKYQLNQENAEMIIKRINEIIEKPQEKLSVNLLLRKKEEEIRIFFNQNIRLKIRSKEIEKITIDYMTSLIDFVENKNDKFLYLLIISNYCMRIKNTSWCINIINNVLDHSEKYNSFKQFIVFILHKQRINSIENKYEDTIKLYHKCKNAIENLKNDSEIRSMVYYNFALAFQRKNNIAEAIVLYKESMKKFKEKDRLFSCTNNLGICLYKQKKNKEAINIFLRSQQYIHTAYQKAVNYSNLLLCYIELKKEFSIKITKDKLETIIEEVPASLRYQSYYCLGKAYISKNNRYSAMINFEKEISLPLDPNNSQFYINKYKECILFLIKIYNTNDIHKFKKLEKMIIKIPKQYMDVNFIFSILEVYLDVYNKEECKEMIKKLKG